MPGVTMEMLSDGLKGAALDRVLGSQVLARSPQLRGFLAYVCQAEMGGRGAALNEYLIGVEALGRPQDFSPTEDAIVRNRAHALRQRLDEYYRGEGVADSVRIELPKGSYCPRFLSTASPLGSPPDATALASNRQALVASERAGDAGDQTSVLLEPALASQADPAAHAFLHPHPHPHSDPHPRGGVSSWEGRLWPIWPALVGMAIGAALMALWLPGWSATTTASASAAAGASAARPGATKWVSAFWGPLLGPDADVLICIAAPAHVMLRAIEGSPPDRMWAPIPLLERWFRDTSPTPVPNGAHVYSYPYWSSPVWGDAVGGMTVVPVLARAGVSYGIMPERVVSLHTTRARNLIVVGNPELSAITRHYLGSMPFTIAYDTAQREWGIVPTRAHPQGEAGPRFLLGPESLGVRHTYGLITVMPSEGTVEREKQTVLLSGLTSSGTQAAAEFFASEAELATLAGHFQREGHAKLPAAYQVIVDTTTSNALPLTVRYHRHIAIPSASH